MPETVVQSIPEYYRGKEIFITGGTGFLGKVVIEKLLRSCPDVKKIYVLIRKKKDQTPGERIQKLLEDEIFSILKEVNPDALKKLVAVTGDVSELKLGLSEEDRALLRAVHVVFHMAASVRFDDPLRKATLMNTRGTREVMELMLEMSCLEVGVHVSTTYCNTDKDVIEERVYRDHGDWKEAIKVAEGYQDDYKVACLTEKNLGGLRNTYLVTKHLAENVVEDYSGILPLVLFRPGIVFPIWRDPIPGWLDNINGPVGPTLAAGKGFLRAVNVNPDCVVDNMPVDILVRSLIISAWKKGIGKDTERLPVYNGTMQGQFFLTQKEAGDVAHSLICKYPYNGSMWFPTCAIVNNKTEFKIKFLFYNVMLALLFDYVLLPLAGRKPMLCKLTRRTYFAINSLSYFGLRNWDFRSRKYWQLNDYLKPCDRGDFDFNVKEFNYADFAINVRFGLSKYFLKENIDLPAARKSQKLFKILHYFVKYLSIGSVIYFFLTRRYIGETVDFIKNMVI